MKLKLFLLLSISFLTGIILISSCKEIIEPSITKSRVALEAPTNNYHSTASSVSFWWDNVSDALYYRLQVVTPTFDKPGKLMLDSLVSSNKFTLALDSGKYQWRVRAENGSSYTDFTAPRGFTVLK